MLRDAQHKDSLEQENPQLRWRDGSLAPEGPQAAILYGGPSRKPKCIQGLCAQPVVPLDSIIASSKYVQFYAVQIVGVEGTGTRQCISNAPLCYCKTKGPRICYCSDVTMLLEKHILMDTPVLARENTRLEKVK